MLEDYFVKPQTVDRIRASWIGPEIERYVDWLSGHGYRARNVPRRVPVLVAFGEFARARGAETVQDLHEYSCGKPTRTAGCAAPEEGEAARHYEWFWQRPATKISDYS